MNATARTRIIKIGNSQGIRIPKLFLQQVHLGDEVELEVQDTQIVIRPAHRQRQGWEERFKEMASQGDDQLLNDEPCSLTNWDGQE